MRVARFVCALAVLAIPFLSCPRLASAADEPHFRITLEDGSAFDAVWVEAQSLGSIRYRTATGDVGYLNRSKVLAIEDAAGRNRRAEVVIDGRALGTALPEEQRSMGRWLASPVRNVSDRERRSYFLAEAGATGQVGGGGARNVGSGTFFGSFGGMKNLGRNWAMGGVAEFHRGGDNYHFIGAGLRVRRYLNDYVSLQGTTGLFAASYDDGHAVPVLPIYADAGVTLAGMMTLFGRFEHHRVRYTAHSYYPYSTQLPTSSIDTDNVLRFGFRIGPRPLPAAVPMAIVMTMFSFYQPSRATQASPAIGY